MPILQSALAAALAFYIAHRVVGHPEPFFAPIAAVLSLGVSLGQRTRRSIELIVGVALGVLVADLLAQSIGRGTLQIALFVALAMAVAVLAGGGPLVVNQGASSAILIATLAPIGDPGTYGFSRFIDALIGGLVGLAVNAVLLPLNPVVIARRAANSLLDELSGTLEDIGTALEAGDPEAARAASRRATEAEMRVAAFESDLDAGAEITRIAPARWRQQGHLAQYVEAVPSVGEATGNIRVLARRAEAMLRTGGTGAATGVGMGGVPGDRSVQLAVAVLRLAEAVRALRNELAKGVVPLAARIGLVHAAELATETIGPDQALSASVVVAQVRSTVVDLLRATGLSRQEAGELLDEISPGSR